MSFPRHTQVTFTNTRAVSFLKQWLIRDHAALYKYKVCDIKIEQCLKALYLTRKVQCKFHPSHKLPFLNAGKIALTCNEYLPRNINLHEPIRVKLCITYSTFQLHLYISEQFFFIPSIPYYYLCRMTARLNTDQNILPTEQYSPQRKKVMCLALMQRNRIHLSKLILKLSSYQVSKFRWYNSCSP